MSGFTTPGGERFQLFGEGGGQELADEIDVPLLGKVPLTMPLREQADAGMPLVFDGPRRPGGAGDPPGRARLIAMSPIELPVLQAAAPAPRRRSRSGMACRWPSGIRSTSGAGPGSPEHRPKEEGEARVSRTVSEWHASRPRPDDPRRFYSGQAKITFRRSSPR